MNCKEDSRDIVASQFKNCQLIYHICDIFHEFQINKISLTIVCKICALAEKHINIHIQSNPYNTDLGVFSYEKEWEMVNLKLYPRNLRT